MAARLSALRADRPLPPGHFSGRLSRPQGHSAAGRIRSIEKSNDLIGNQTRDVPACSIVPQPTTLPRSPPPPIFKLFDSVIKAVRWIQCPDTSSPRNYTRLNSALTFLSSPKIRRKKVSPHIYRAQFDSRRRMLSFGVVSPAKLVYSPV
jgi:hypothetical protein